LWTETLDPIGREKIPPCNLIDDLEKETWWDSISNQENVVVGQPSPTAIFKPCSQIQPNKKAAMAV